MLGVVPSVMMLAIPVKEEVKKEPKPQESLNEDQKPIPVEVSLYLPDSDACVARE